jgi:GT2 family glycosyltransferase
MTRYSSNEPRIGVLILNWNGWKDTINSINSTIKSSYKNFFIVICDNGSDDRSSKNLKDWAGTISTDCRSENICDSNQIAVLHGKDDNLINLFLIQNSENLGFAGGCNVGISFLLDRGADYVFLLNNDAVISDQAIDSLVSSAIEAQASIAGAQIYNSDGSELLYSGLKWPHELFAIYIRPEVNSTDLFWRTDGVNGCACLIRKDILKLREKDCGYFFDPEFFLYCEETDLCLYNKSKGYQSIIVRDAKCFHEVSKSSGGHGSPLSYYYYTRNRIFLAEKWTSKLIIYSLKPYYLCSRLIIIFSKLRKPDSYNTIYAIAKGLQDGYSGIKGKSSYFSK